MAEKWPPGPRHREDSQYNYLHGALYTQQSTPGWWDPPHAYISAPVVTPIQTYKSIIDRKIDDIVVANYHHLVKVGARLPINPVDAQYANWYQTLSKLDAELIYGTNHAKWYGSINPLTNVATISAYPISDDSKQRCYDSALTAAFAKAKSSNMNIIASCTELADTRKMLVKGLKSVVSITKNLKRFWRYWKASTSKKRTAKHAYKRFEETWMEIRMGYLPFVSEVMQVYDNLTGVRRYEYRQTFRASKAISSSNADSLWLSSPSHPILYNVSRTAVETYTASAGIVCTQRFRGVPDPYGLGTLPATLWELTPLSWVVDYFFNIGNLISSWTPDPFWEVEGSWITETSETTESNSICGSKPKSSFYIGSLTGGHNVYQKKRVKRTPNPGRPVLPTLSPYFTWARYTDTAFVTRQQFNKAFNRACRIRLPR